MLRMMKEGGFGEAFAAFDVIFKKNKKLMTTSVFVGLTTWLMLSSFYHIAERNNPNMIWIVSWLCFEPLFACGAAILFLLLEIFPSVFTMSPSSPIPNRLG